MAKDTHLLTPGLYNYLKNVSLREDRILTDLRQETGLLPNSKMQISAEQGQLMQLLVRLLGAQHILEIGAFTGYSTLAMALAMSDSGQIISCDNNEGYTAIARKYWERAGVLHKIELHLEDAAILIRKLNPSRQFDLIFLDADQMNYNLYYELLLPLLRPGGLLLVDDTLWEGKVLEENPEDEAAKAIKRLNERILQDQRVHISLIPIGDGLTLVLKDNTAGDYHFNLLE